MSIASVVVTNESDRVVSLKPTVRDFDQLNDRLKNPFPNEFSLGKRPPLIEAFTSRHVSTTINAPIEHVQTADEFLRDRHTAVRDRLGALLRGPSMPATSFTELAQPLSSLDIMGASLALSIARRLLGQERIREARMRLREAEKRYPEDEAIRELLRSISPGRTTRQPVTSPSRSREFEWIRTNQPRYKGKWVALLGSDLLGHGRTLAEVLDSLTDDSSGRKPLIHRIR